MHSERVWQGYVWQDVFVDVGLTWRVSPEVSKGRASRTKVSTPRWEVIVRKLLGKINLMY